MGLALVAAACSAPLAAGDETVVSDDQPVEQADLAPNVDLVYFDGSTGSLEELRGRPVVLNFWASWCPACIAEMPDFEAVHQRFYGDVVFVGVNLQDVDRATAERFVVETGVTYPIADDPTGAIYASFGGFAMPTTVYIDADGEIVGRQDGAIFEDQLVEQIEELFGVSS